ncbi:unnamed protein product, partial [Oikopleura dioica]
TNLQPQKAIGADDIRPRSRHFSWR